jgi:hypothetical protein
MENKNITPLKKTAPPVTPLPIKKTAKQLKQEIVAKFVAKNNKMIRGQFLTYGLKGVREMDLTWKIDSGNVHKKHVKHGDIIHIPFGYAKYLNEHGSIKKAVNTGMKLRDSSGFNMDVNAEDNEVRYVFRPLDVLSSEELAELDPSTIVKATTQMSMTQVPTQVSAV